MSTYLCGSPSNDQYIVELLRRAIVQGDQDARVGVQHYLSGVVRGWLRWHPNREAVYRLDSEENYVAVAFERFWQGTIDQQIEFSTLATVLHYLQVSLNGALLDRLRASSRPNEVPLPWPGSPEEPLMEDMTSGGGHVFTYRGHSDVVEAVAWSPDGKRIASGSDDNTVQVWVAA